MLRAWSTVACSAVLFWVAPAFAESKVAVGPETKGASYFRIPALKEARLANGIRVRLVERHDVPLVSIHVISTIGAGDAAPGVAKVAAEAAVDSAQFSARMRAGESLNSIGARVSAYANFARTGVASKALAPYLDQAVADVADIVRAQFPDSDIFRRERDAAVDELEKDERSSASHVARGMLFPSGHPYHFPHEGTSAALRSLEIGAVRGFWARAFTPAHMVIVVAGDVTMERLLAVLTKNFGNLPPGEATAPSAPAAPAVAERNGITLVDRPGATQAQITVAGMGLPRSDANFLALSVATRVLDGMLHSRIREAYGSSYGVDATLETERGAAPFWVRGAVENAGTAAAIGAVMSTMADLRSGKRTIDESSRMSSFNAIASSFETTDQTARLLVSGAAVGVSLDELRALPERFRAVTAEQVTKVAQTHFDPARLRIVVCGDAKVLTPQLEKLNLGPVVLRKP